MIALLLAFGIGFNQPVAECDCIELNYTYRGKCGEAELVQVIFWRWHLEGSSKVLRAHGFYIVRGEVLPEKRGGMWQIDCGGKVVRARLYRETHTDADPEREDLKRWKIERFNPIEK